MNDQAEINLSVQTLLDERHALRQQRQHLPIGKGQWIGAFRGNRRGHGSEFDDLRHYYPGDDARHIDWKASARTHVMHTRLYREEKEIRTTIVADLRDTMFTGSIELQAVRVCKVAAHLIWQSTSAGSRTNVMVITDAGISLSEPGSSHHAAIDACALLASRFQHVQRRLCAPSSMLQTNDLLANDQLNDTVIELPPDTDSERSDTLSLERVIQWLLERRGKRSTLLWISAFEHCGNHFERDFSLLCQTSDNAAIIVEDPLLRSGLPSGRYGYSSSHRQSDATGHHSGRKHRDISLGQRSAAQLHANLITQAARRKEQFAKLMVPMFTLDSELHNLVVTLRHDHWLP